MHPLFLCFIYSWFHNVMKGKFWDLDSIFFHLKSYITINFLYYVQVTTHNNAFHDPNSVFLLSLFCESSAIFYNALFS